MGGGEELRACLHYHLSDVTYIDLGVWKSHPAEQHKLHWLKVVSTLHYVGRITPPKREAEAVMPTGEGSPIGIVHLH